MIKAIILDLDGLISDTERLHMKAFQKAFLEKEVCISDDYYKKHWIQKGLGTEEAIKYFQLNEEPETIRAIKNKYFEHYLKTDLKPMPYALDFIKHFYKRLPMAVASASKGRDVEFILKSLGLVEYIEFFFSADDVKNRKPDPEVWLKAAKKLGLEPGECICLEDAEKGVLAAYKGKLPVIAIPNIYTANNDFSKASYLAKDMKEAIEIVDNLITLE